MIFQVSTLLHSEVYQQISLDLAGLLFSLWTRQTHKLVGVFSSLYDAKLRQAVFICHFIAKIQPPSN